MDDKEIMVITGVYIALIIFMAAMILIAGPYIRSMSQSLFPSLTPSTEFNSMEIRSTRIILLENSPSFFCATIEMHEPV